MFTRLQAQDPQAVQHLAQQYPDLAPILPGVNPGEEVSPSALFAAVAAALTELATDRPVLVVLEDAHWADRSTRELLTALLSRPVAAPVLLVISYRADDLHRRHPLRRRLSEWGRLAGVERLTLDPLDDESIGQLVRALAPGADPGTVVARAAGNPFFAEELAAAGACAGSQLPDDLADLLLVRTDSLPEDARVAVRAAAAAGRTVEHEVLAAVLDLDQDDLDEALRAALDAHVLAARADGYLFRHALLTEAVHDDLLPGERRRLHARYAQVLNERRQHGAAAATVRHAASAGL